MIEVAQDPWVHRSANMSCQTCMWFVAKFSNTPVKPDNHKIIGRCRKHAPTMSGYPAVYPTDWCGDHKLDENKI